MKTTHNYLLSILQSFILKIMGFGDIFGTHDAVNTYIIGDKDMLLYDLSNLYSCVNNNKYL